MGYISMGERTSSLMAPNQVGGRRHYKVIASVQKPMCMERMLLMWR